MTASRSYSNLLADADDRVIAALERLTDESLPPKVYGETMALIGEALGKRFAERCDVACRNVYLAVTVEDADFLAAGIARALESAGATISVACYWNVRQKRGGIKWLDVATIADEYAEPLPERLDHLIVVKSIISGACVVKTNLAHLLDRADPERIHVMAPVVLAGAQERLAAEFEPALATRFEYWLFATDTEKDDSGNVRPGIGGEIYSRLGFGGQQGKNAHLPHFVMARSGMLPV